MSAVQTWRYRLPYNQKGDGGTFFIDSTGVFLSLSAYGEYGHRWTSIGSYCIRSFVAQINPDYAYSKFAHGRGRRGEVFDGAATAREIRRHLFEYQKNERPDWWADEVDLIDEVGRFGFDDRSAFDEWCRATHLEEWWCFGKSKPEPECWAFCTLLLPRLQARLRFDLTREARAA